MADNYANIQPYIQYSDTTGVIDGKTHISVI